MSSLGCYYIKNDFKISFIAEVLALVMLTAFMNNNILSFYFLTVC